jgi:hypothetical protein
MLEVSGWSISNFARRAAVVACRHPLMMYWLPTTIAVAAFAFLLSWRWRTLSGPSPRRPPSVTAVALSALACLLLMQWPVLGLFELNPDESYALAGAITLSHDPNYWRSVDNLTHGPLVAFALVPARIFGLAFDYGWARLLALLMMWGVLLSMYGTLRRLTSESAAALMLLAGVLCIGSLIFGDFVAYDAEQPTLLLLGMSGYWVARMSVARRGVVLWAFAAGLSIGLVPLAKLQGCPLAACLAVVAVTVLLRRRELASEGRIRAVVGFMLGGLLPVVALAIYLWWTALFGVFWTSYVATNLAYANRHGLGILEQWARFVKFVARQGPREAFMPPLALWCFGGLAVAVVAWRRMRRRDKVILPVATTLVGAGAYAVCRPANDFDHYFLFLLPPVIFLAGTLLGSGLHTLAAPRARRHLVVAYLVLCILIPVLRVPRLRNPILRNPSVFAKPWPGAAVASVVRRYASASDPLVVWGWMARYHVLTGMPQGTATSDPIYEILRIPFFESRFLAQLKANKPPVFIDAVGPGAFAFHDRGEYGHERYPWLAAWLRPRYQLVADIQGARVYVSTDRIAALAKSRARP